MSEAPLLEALGLTLALGGKTRVEEVSLQVHSGEVVSLLGPNGAGKSTTFDLLVGLARPDRGSVFLCGRDVTGAPPHLRARQGLSFLAQDPTVFQGLTVRQNVLAILEIIGVSRRERGLQADALLEKLGLLPVAHTRAEKVSGGERRRVEIARALATRPRLLLLDEPFAGIDPRTVLELSARLRQLKEEGIGLLIADHGARDLLPLSDRVYLLLGGRVAFSGTVPQILESEMARQSYLGPSFRL